MLGKDRMGDRRDQFLGAIREAIDIAGDRHTSGAPEPRRLNGCLLILVVDVQQPRRSKDLR